MSFKLMNYDEFVSDFQSVSRSKLFTEEKILAVAKEKGYMLLKGSDQKIRFDIVALDVKIKDLVEFQFEIEAAEDRELKEYNVRYLGMT